MSDVADQRAAEARLEIMTGLDEAALTGRRRARIVLIYAVLALVALLPGLLAQLLDEPGRSGAPGWAGMGLREALKDIHFGSGLRFWLGVAGTSLMLLLLLYPLRKALAGRRAPGSVGFWFHAHMLIGLAAPVLVLYHANFGPGALNANVALAAMLVIVLSGLAGFFVHAPASAAFHGGMRQARLRFDEFAASLRALQGLHASTSGLIERLERVEAQAMEPRRGVLASLAMLRTVSVRGKELDHDLDWLITSGAGEQGWSGELQHVRKRALQQQLAAHLAAMRAVVVRGIADRLWSRWRLLHFPVLVIMSAAIVLHVRAVWNMEPPPAGEASRSGEIQRASAAAKGIQQLRRTTIEIAPRTAGRPAESMPLPVETGKPADPDLVPPTVIAVPAPRPAVPRSKGAMRAASAPGEDMAVTAAPPSLPPPPSATRAADRPRTPEPSSAPASDENATAEARATAPGNDAVAELKRRLQEGRMALGASTGQTLVEQFAVWKAKMAARQFSHAAHETGFALSGNHTRLECTKCHAKAPTGVKSGNPRACIACHKKDDVHRGRRNDCAQCHNAVDWSEPIKRR